MICRKSMTACQTPGMCSPHGGCQATEQVSSAWLAQLRAEYLGLAEENKALKDQVKRLSLQKHIAENATAGAAQVKPMKTSTLVLLGLAGGALSFVLAGIAATWKPFPEHAWVADRKVQLKPALASDDPMLKELAAWERSQKAAKP